MAMHERVGSGLRGFDRVIDDMRLGDNVVWQVDSIDDYRNVAVPFAENALSEGRKLIYFRFGMHEPILNNSLFTKKYEIDSKKGFESFASEIRKLIEKEGLKALYVFDCLTDLLEFWHSDLMIANFFKVTCPFLYDLETIAYFAIMRNSHTYSTIAGIRETTQLLLDLYNVGGRRYIHPLKVWQRYSPTMFFPHLVEGDEASSITSSMEVAELFSSLDRGKDKLDHWQIMLGKAGDTLTKDKMAQEDIKRELMSTIIGGGQRMFDLCDRYFTLADILAVASREIGTGFIGGKSVGMLVARKILEKEAGEKFTRYLEPHDSFYLGSDIFYTYIVQNGWWSLRTRQKTREGYFSLAPELKEKLLKGKFPSIIKEQFYQMLEYFGQSPIIVRSSSLQEDNFGNAFAGKYESVFCANQGTPEERYEALEQAIRNVYASTMSDDALNYRLNRGLSESDEQMAILVQRVSGDYHGPNFYPHLAGVGNSTNLYVWDKDIDITAGMLRMVFGLGTRAVERSVGDYAHVVCLDNPMRTPHIGYGDEKKFSQHYADVISIVENSLLTRNVDELVSAEIGTDRSLFASIDFRSEEYLKERGYSLKYRPIIMDFKKLLSETEFPGLMRSMLELISRVYEYPVDIEFTVNFTKEGRFKVNLVQCRPLQTRGLGTPVEMPKPGDCENCLIRSKGNFMGGNVRLPLDYTILVKTKEYLKLDEQGKYEVARTIGKLNDSLKGYGVMLVGPGRWGTTTPTLGVPVHFTEISNMAVICEVSSAESGLMPELSFGSHFFQDLVETGIFYAAIFDGKSDVTYNPMLIMMKKNRLNNLIAGADHLSEVIHVASTEGMEIFADIVSQTLVCR